MNDSVYVAAEAGSGRCRSPARRAAYLCGLAVAVGLLAFVISPFDLLLSRFLHVPGGDQVSVLLWHVAQPVKLFGKGDILIVMGLLLAIYGRKQLAVTALMAVLIAGLIVAPTKSLVERQRPSGRDTRSFPSGDAAAVAAFTVPIVSAFPVTAPFAAAAVVLIGTARVATGFHFPSDILAGIAVGLFSGALVLSIPVRVNARRRRFLRRSWCAAALGVFVVIRLAMSSGSDVRQFLFIFGPALVLAAGGPFLRAALRKERVSSPVSIKRGAPLVAAALAALILAGYLFVTTRSTLWDRDEPRFSEATVEMVHSGDYLVPTFRGELRPDKPILIYWLMSLPVRLLGPTELACRFFAPVGAAVACLLTYIMACQLSGTGAGLLSMIILATSPLLLMTGTAATTDAVLLAMIAGSFAIFENGFRKGLRKIHVLGLALTFGGALLTKGPVGLVVPILGMLVILAFARRLSWRWGGTLFISAFLGSFIFLAWAIPANDATGGEFLRRGIGYHVVARTVRPIDSHGGNFFFTLPFYIPVVIFAFFPWVLFLPGALSAVAGGRVGGTVGRSFLLGWMVSIFLLMSFVSTKLPHYILPIWPALALAVAGTIQAAGRGVLAPRDLRLFSYGRRFFAAIGVIGGAALVLGPWFVPALVFNSPGLQSFGPGLAWPIAGLGAILLIMTLLAVREHSAGRYRSTVGILAAGLACVIFTVSIFGLPMMEKFKLSKPLADTIRRETAADVLVWNLDYDEPSLIFYLGRRHLKAIGSEAGVIAWAKQPQPGVVVISKQALKKIELTSGPLGLKQIAAIQGFNYSKGRWAEIVALARNLP